MWLHLHKTEKEAKQVYGIKTQDSNHFGGGPVVAGNGHEGGL